MYNYTICDTSSVYILGYCYNILAQDIMCKPKD